MKNIQEKLNIAEMLYKIGFKKECIAYVLFRIEECNEDIGHALWHTVTVLDESKENVENKENVA